MDWNHELLASALWLAKAFAICAVVLTLTILWLANGTGWGPNTCA